MYTGRVELRDAYFDVDMKFVASAIGFSRKRTSETIAHSLGVREQFFFSFSSLISYIPMGIRSSRARRSISLVEFHL